MRHTMKIMKQCLVLLTLTRSVLGGQLGSDGEVDDDDYPELNPKTDMLDPQFCLGLKFATLKIFRAIVRERAIQKGWIPVLARTDKDKIRVICKADNCPFEMYAVPRRKLDASTSQTQNNTSKKGPLSTNDLRKKIQLKAQRLKEKRDLKKAEQAAAAAKKSNVSRGSNGRSATTSRPSAATTTMSSVTTSTPAISRATALTPTRVNPHPKPSSSRQATSTRSSTRIRSTDGKR
ncbi:hypothetical protein ACLB2K_035224 [Fragaria x ananassa]